MKKKITIGILLLMSAAGTYFLKIHTTTDPTRPNTPADLPALAVQEVPARTEDDFFAKMLAEAKAKLPSDYVLTPEELERMKKNAVPRALDIVGKSEALGKQIDLLLECPVEIYGQVLDQNDVPVVGAKIMYHTFPGGPMTRVFNVLSAAPEGRFEVKDMNAAAIALAIEPPAGYQRTSEYFKEIPIVETLEMVQLSEEYKKLPQAAQLVIPTYLMMSRPSLPTYKPDKANPVIFRLKKL